MEPLNVQSGNSTQLSLPTDSTSPVHISNASQTEIRVEYLKHQWQVKNFSHCYQEYLESFVHLPRGSETLSWSIKIYPKGNGENNKDFVFCCLNFVLSSSAKNKVGFRSVSYRGFQLRAPHGIIFSSRFFLKNNEGKDIEMRIHPSPSHSDYVSYIKRDVLFPLISPADSITVFVEIDVAVETITTNTDDQLLPRAKCDCERQLADDFLRLLRDGLHPDFVIKVSSSSLTRDIPVHKAILAARSPFFAAMLAHSDTEEVRTGTMKIEDVEYAVVKEMLQFIYTGRCSADMHDMCSDLLIAADKYGLEELKNDCERILIQNLACDNVCTFLVISDLYTAEKLRQRAVQFILQRPKEITGTSGWELLLRDHAHAHLVTDIVRNFDKSRSPMSSGDQCAMLGILSANH